VVATSADTVGKKKKRYIITFQPLKADKNHITHNLPKVTEYMAKYTINNNIQPQNVCKKLFSRPVYKNVAMPLVYATMPMNTGPVLQRCGVTVNI